MKHLTQTHRIFSGEAMRNISFWLWIIAFTIFVMIGLGGATRLTGSGLSMVTWDVFTGILPPWNEEQWKNLWQLYGKTPEGRILNAHFTLGDFKNIFWLEYIHRLWGRLIGVLILVPLWLSWRHHPQSFFPILGIFLLVIFQGFLGWIMVKSGLKKDPHVSHYRLACHLFFGFLTYGCALWYGWTLSRVEPLLNQRKWLKINFFILMILIVYGAFVAGLKAGLIYNTFPKMGDFWIPPELDFYGPFWVDIVSNPVTIQWIHRFLAITFALSSVSWIYVHRSIRLKSSRHFFWFWLLFIVVMVQFTLGILTLIYHVPVFLGTLHQLGAVLVMTCYLRWLHP